MQQMQVLNPCLPNLATTSLKGSLLCVNLQVRMEISKCKALCQMLLTKEVFLSSIPNDIPSLIIETLSILSSFPNSIVTDKNVIRTTLKGSFGLHFGIKRVFAEYQNCGDCGIRRVNKNTEYSFLISYS